MNVTVDGTHLYLHELRVYSPAPLDWCGGTPDDKHTNIMDYGECGVNGWAEGGDVVHTSTHNKDEYTITVQSSGILSGGEAPDGHDEHNDHNDHVRRMLTSHKHAGYLRKKLLCSLQDHDEGHASHGGGGGVEHPLHGVDNVLFAADGSSGIALQYAVKTFDEEFDSFTIRSGSFDLATSEGEPSCFSFLMMHGYYLLQATATASYREGSFCFERAIFPTARISPLGFEQRFDQNQPSAGAY